jgi:GNAT superfamily N-acetyltransferase
MHVTVRKATAVDAAALAAFRWGQFAEQEGHTGIDRRGFLELFSAWVVEHLSTHLPFVAEVDGDMVGMAWLMVADRVSSPARQHRRWGDVQSTYVVPQLRNSGVGAALLNDVLAEARRLELEHITVHSSDRAVYFYQRVGFERDQRWLRWEPEPRTA